MISRALRWSLLLSISTVAAPASVVINEIFYNAPGDLEELEWIELWNTGDGPQDLGGWKLARGLEHTFAAGTSIPSNGFLVLARNPDLFKEHYGFAAHQSFKGELSGKSMRLDLMDSTGKRVDSARYKDESPWPTGADGYSGSLERICPASDGTRGESWASSPLDSEMKPSGTPGKPNASYSATLPPVIVRARFTPSYPLPDQAVTVEAVTLANTTSSDRETPSEESSRLLANPTASPQSQRPSRCRMNCSTLGSRWLTRRYSCNVAIWR